MACLARGAPHPAGARFCPQCGAALGAGASARPAEVQYRDLLIPLDLAALDLFTGGTAAFDRVVEAELRQAYESGGWVADEPTDFASLRQAGRLMGGIVRDFGGRSDFTGVTIRLRRRVQVLDDSAGPGRAESVR